MNFRSIVTLVLRHVPQWLILIASCGFCIATSEVAMEINKNTTTPAKSALMFATCYSATTVLVSTVIGILYLYFVGDIPFLTIAILIFSSFGIWVAMAFDAMLLRADHASILARQSQKDALTRKHIYLAGVLGMMLVIVVSCIPYVCPLEYGNNE